MKKTRILAGAILAGGLWSGSALAQAPAAAAAAPANPAAVAEAKPGICEKIEKGIDRKRRKMCQTPLGQMLNSITKPFGAFTGGIIPGFCPAKPSEADLKKPGAEGAAAQAKKDAVEASARRAAVRLMGTFDCHWYPEVEAGLAAALRTDRAECVRLEAAIALNRGCCCTRLIVEALEETVGGTDKLGPSENSPRVQMVAQMALERCLTCPEAMAVIEAPPVDDSKKEERPGEEAPAPRPANEPGSAKPMNPAAPTFGPTSTQKGSGKPSRELLLHAKRTLAAVQARQARTGIVNDEPLPAGQRSLAGLANYVVHGGQATVVQTSTPPLALSTPAPARTVVTATHEKPATPRPTFAAPQKLAPASIQTPPITPPAAKATKSHTIDPAILRCLESLRDAEDPEMRYAAVKTLASCNWREHPQAVSGLIYAARHDSHAGMRVACIRSLAAMKAATPEVMTALKPMTSDRDEWISQETKHALAFLQACGQ